MLGLGYLANRPAPPGALLPPRAGPPQAPAPTPSAAKAVQARNILGLSADKGAALRGQLTSIPGVEHVAVYGSRAPGAARAPAPASDIDIILVKSGQLLSKPQLGKLEQELSRMVGKAVNIMQTTAAEYSRLWKGHINEARIE